MVWVLNLFELNGVSGSLAYYNNIQLSNDKSKINEGQKYKDTAFISGGFNNWKDGTVGFTKHEVSDCHKETVQVMKVIPYETQNVGEQLCHVDASNKRLNRRMLLKILQNVIFLARQNIALRGDKDESDSNFNQLLCLRACDDFNIKDWL